MTPRVESKALGSFNSLERYSAFKPLVSDIPTCNPYTTEAQGPATPEAIGASLVAFFRFYAGEMPDHTPEAAIWQKWSTPFKFTGEMYVMGVQVDFGGCAMGEVGMVFNAVVKMLAELPQGQSQKPTTLSRLIDEGIMVGILSRGGASSTLAF